MGYETIGTVKGRSLAILPARPRRPRTDALRRSTRATTSRTWRLSRPLA